MIGRSSFPPRGWRLWGIGVALIGAANLGLGDFDPAQPVSRGMPGFWLFFWSANIFLVLAGIAVQWRRLTVAASAALTLYFAIVVVILMNGPVIAANATTYGAYSGTAEELALAAAGLIIFSRRAALDERAARRLTKTGQIVFAICAILFGGAHFVYMNLTWPLVPAWLPPSQRFWGYATGVAHILAGVAILTRIRSRIAAILLTAMYASFTLLVHLPLLFGDPHKPYYWTENVLNIALIGAAWVVADSFRPQARPQAT